MSDDPKPDLRTQFRDFAEDGHSFFKAAKQEVIGKIPEENWYSTSFGGDEGRYWDCLSRETQAKSGELIDRILPTFARLSHLAKGSPLTGEEDVRDVKEATKAIRAALRLRRYWYHDTEVLHDEGAVLGVRRAEQSEDEPESPKDAYVTFSKSLTKVASILKLVEASGFSNGETLVTGADPASKYRSGTAFIMMWMDPERPELTDVVDTVRSVFASFGIKAIRADEIEHEGQITPRILDEIRTSEFLFADLTGTRPNVYYEVGFAHALGKRVILYKSMETPIHFDLAGYNCPSYSNQRDLREKLVKRLVSLTNRNPVTPQNL